MRQSQNAGILQALKDGAKITPMGALRRFGCFRLSARIADIRKMGYKVKTRIINLFGKKVRVLGIRRLTPTECARLQTIPTWYKWECSDSQAYRMLGNGWTVEVIKHFFQFLPFEREA
jgi:hypothetical protein